MYINNFNPVEVWEWDCSICGENNILRSDPEIGDTVRCIYCNNIETIETNLEDLTREQIIANALIDSLDDMYDC